MELHVTSEFGRLREAIVHRPGRELVRMTPSTRDYFLFDDLLFTDHAQQEHDWLTSLLRDHLGVRVHYFDDLLAEALQSAPQRERRALISQVCRLESGMPPVEQRIGQLEVMVRWFQGHGWPQYTQDTEGDPGAAAPGGTGARSKRITSANPGKSGPATLTALLSHTHDTGPLSAQDIESFDFLQHRLESWCDEGDYSALAEELVEGIEARAAGASPSERPGPGNGAGRRQRGEGRGQVTDDNMDALRRFVEGRLFYLTPLPNLMFMRDIGTVVNERLLLARMAAPGRTREPLLLDFMQRNHRLFKKGERWTWADARINDPAWPAASSPMLHLEGGNVLQLREDLIVLGVSGRTSMEAIQRISDVWRAYAQKRGVKMILYVLRLPAGFNHLDSVFGVLSDKECVIYPPVFEPYGPASVDVVRVELGKEAVRPTRSADFFESLRRDALDLTPISCGGQDPVDQQREQWFSAANLLALAPGKVVIYRSSERTAAELAKHGYQLIDINDVQTGAVKLDLDSPGKWALKIKGSELSRGHGGPHSLVLPLVRDA
jgi:arginine deiminase